MSYVRWISTNGGCDGTNGGNGCGEKEEEELEDPKFSQMDPGQDR